MTAKRSGLGRLGAWLVAAACAAVLTAPSQAEPRRSQTRATLDDRLYEIALSSSTPDAYRKRLERLLKRREHERTRALKMRQGPRRGGALGPQGLGPAARLARMSVPDPALRRLLRGRGGEVRRADRAAVVVPPAALGENSDITVSQPGAADEAARQAVAANAGKAQASLPVAFGPEGTTFLEPVTVTLPYDAALVASQGLREADLKVHYWNARSQRWEDLPSTVDQAQKTVSAQTTHFSVYQVLAPGGGIGAAAADAGFGFKAAYAFPNPSRSGAAVTFRVQPGPADSITVRVYDVAGRKVHESYDFRSLGAFDDGNGLGQQFTYEHVWDVSGVGSGVYTYAVVARKAGERDIRKAGKVAVVK